MGGGETDSGLQQRCKLAAGFIVAAMTGSRRIGTRRLFKSKRQVGPQASRLETTTSRDVPLQATPTLESADLPRKQDLSQMLSFSG